MDIHQLSVSGAWVFTPRQFFDGRGTFVEWYKADLVEQSVGNPLSLAQANHSVSSRDVLRGVHYADVPPGQAKYIYCPTGAVLDVVVDIRVGSPTFGRADTVRLDDVHRCGLYLAEGLGHAFLALSDGAAVTYLCSTPFTPAREHGINPLDPELDIDWPADVAPRLSPKDASAPTLAQAKEAGLLPTYDRCLEVYSTRTRPSGQ